jgi:phosphatidylinositol-3-phosphatase
LVIVGCVVLAVTAAAVSAGRPVEDLSERQAVSVPEYVPHLRHVIVVVLENKAIGDVVGSSSVTGPNLGTTLPPGSWKTYAEGLPSGGWTGAASGAYAKKHDPFVYFRDLADNRSLLHRSIVPFRSLARDLKRYALPRFALVVPDECHDMHDCSVSTGDAWLGRFITPLLRSPALRDGVIFIIFDEGSGSNHVPALAIGPAVRARSTFNRATDHFGLLRTIEQALNLPLLARSRNAQAIGGIWR